MVDKDILRFPPLITPVRLRERQDAFADACRAAGRNEAEAGSLFFVGRFELIELAIVLEPHEPLRLARKIVFAAMNALADALALLAPPEKPIGFRFPCALYFDGALVGGGRLAAAPDTADDRAPDWLVFGAMVRAGGMREHGPGQPLDLTTLDDEGFEAWNPPDFAASFARNFLVEVDSWAERGMAEIGPRYLQRLDRAGEATRRAIDTNGDLLIHGGGQENARRVALVDALNRPEWYDPLLNEPRS